MSSAAAGAIDMVDTSDQEEVILAIDANRARAGMALGEEFARVVRDLVLGIPVAGREMDIWGITAIGLCDEDEAEALRLQGDLFAATAH